ncbi:hypothetical protein KJ660_01780 [Candidatus Micrarchaeota archaeon]|nr:hypothetical protein [Candidatus Micrarchaeota archaeon]
MDIISVLSEESPLPKSLSDLESRMYELILSKWPTSTLEIAEYFNEDLSSREARKKASSKYSYYLRKLIARNLIVSKKAGNTIIIWPLIVEKYRVIQSILSGKELK